MNQPSPSTGTAASVTPRRELGPASEKDRRDPALGILILGLILLSTFMIRIHRADQPLVENYVGRQIPTAMVARNLERGSGFFSPQLDTGPFPNLFVVEPPVFEQLAVWLGGLTGLSLGASGRIISALGMTLAALGLFVLARRREGIAVALVAVLAFSAFPITIRYGRSFQPDSLMLGLVLCGLAWWDRIGSRPVKSLPTAAITRVADRHKVWLPALSTVDHRSMDDRRVPVPAFYDGFTLTAARIFARALPGWLILSLGLALKVTSAYILIPFVACIGGGAWAWSLVAETLSRLCHHKEVPRWEPFFRWMTRLALAVSMLLPALAWDVKVDGILAEATGSRASADNRAIWLGVLSSTALLSPRTWESVGRFVLWKSFTPLGPVLALAGFLFVTGRGSRDRLWLVWGLSASAALAVLAAKVHHEYYWLSLAPVLAVGVGRALAALEGRFRGTGAVAGAALLVLCGLQARSTWETPAEWSRLGDAGRIVGESVPRDAWVIAPEALIFQGDRRGCRLEYTPTGCRRAAGEWGVQLVEETPIALVTMYRTLGARYFADLTPASGLSEEERARRVALHDEIRRRYKVMVDIPAILLAELN